MDLFAALPMIILALFSIIGGYLLQKIILSESLFEKIFLFPPVMGDIHFIPTIIKISPTLSSLLGVISCATLYSKKTYFIYKTKKLFYPLYILFNKRFFFDALYNKLSLSILKSFLYFFSKNIDSGFLEKIGPMGIFQLFHFIAKKISFYLSEDVSLYLKIIILSTISFSLQTIPYPYVPLLFKALFSILSTFLITYLIVLKIWRAVKKKLEDI